MTSKQIQYTVVGAVVGVILAFISSALLLDTNTKAYVVLLQGLRSGRYETCKECSDRAYSMTNDNELRYIADFFSRSSKIALDYNIQTFDASLMEVVVKSVLTGYLNPIKALKDSLEAWILLAKMHFGDYKTNIDLIDGRYPWRVPTEKILFWLLLIVTPVCSCVYAGKKTQGA